MEQHQLISLAQEYCTHFHNGQVRKGSNQPYATHPFEVANILQRYGYNDPVTQCIALLHDIVEDTQVITGEICERFGYEIANGVFVLSKNTLSLETTEYFAQAMGDEEPKPLEEELYKARLAFARRKVKRVKLADMIHNTKDLVVLPKKSQERKIRDAEEFYIPMGKNIAPLMIKELERNIEHYKQVTKSQ